MKLMTDKCLIVYYQVWRGRYSFCGIKYFKENVNQFWTRPILYTNSFELAREVKNNLNEELRT